MRRILWMVVAAMAGALPARAVEVELGGRGGLWFGDLSGHVKVQRAEIPGSRLTYSGLGMDTREMIPTGEVYFRVGESGKPPRHLVALRYWEQAFRGQTTLGQSITFKGITYNASTTVHSRLAFKELDLRYAYDFWQGKPLERMTDARPSAAWGIFGVKGIGIETEIFSDALGATEENARAPVPVLGLGGRWALGRRLGVEAQALGLAVNVSDTSVSFYEAEAMARWDFSRYLALEAGWRRWSLDFDVSGSTKVDGKAVIQGLTVGLVGRF
jgi:hypothetical protein